jgi:erythromycin esterase-like protein
MEDRISSLESIARMSATLTRIMNEHMDAMDERQQQTEQWQRQAEQWQRQAEQWQRQAEERQRQRNELLQQLLQAVVVMQADIVRIDETHT